MNISGERQTANTIDGMKKVKGVHLDHEWVLQIETHSLFEIARFETIERFWAIFNNIDEILVKVPGGGRLHLFKAIYRSLWADLIGGAWIIPIEGEQVGRSVVDIATTLVGEISNASSDIYGMIVDLNPNSSNYIWVCTSRSPLSTDFVWRIRSVLGLHESVQIRFRNQILFGSRSHSNRYGGWAEIDHDEIETQNDLEPSKRVNGEAMFSYDRQFMKRFALSENCQDLPESVRYFDWNRLRSSPYPMMAVALSPISLAPSAQPTAPWDRDTIITRWIPFQDHPPSSDHDDRQVPSPSSSAQEPPNPDIEYIRLAESCLDEVAKLSIDVEEDCESRSETVHCSASFRHHRSPHHIVGSDPVDAPKPAPNRAEVSPGVIDLSPHAASVTTTLYHVRIDLDDPITNVAIPLIDDSVLSRLETCSDQEYIMIDRDPSSPSPIISSTRGRIPFNCHLVGSGDSFRYEIDFDLESNTTHDNVLLSFIDQYTGNDLIISLSRSPTDYFISSLRYTLYRPSQIPNYSSGGQPAWSSDAAVADVPIPNLMSSPQWATPAPPVSSDHVDLTKDLFYRARMQVASRQLQEELSNATPAQFQTMFDALLPRISELMMEGFGHYIAEKLAAMASRSQRHHLIESLRQRICQIACHKLGSFSLQAIMESLKHTDEIELLFEIIEPFIVPLMLSPSGHYVLLRCLDLFGYPATAFIFEAAANAVQFATDHYGLRVMKIIVGSERHVHLEMVLGALVDNTLLLVENQYGNYIIQLILSREDVGQNTIDTIYDRMMGKFAKMSKQKFSSNVVEQCIRRGSDERRPAVINELISSVGLLIRDRFGNYVLQTALECATRQQSLQLGTAIARNLHLLRDNVRSKWTGILRIVWAITTTTIRWKRSTEVR